MTLEELKHITIEVSILSEPKILEYSNIKNLKSKIVPFQDGIVLKQNSKHATYLPQIWEQLPKFNNFFSSLCLKANS